MSARVEGSVPISPASRVQQGAQWVARWSAIALGFSVIVSTALNGFLMALLLLAWFASGGWQEKRSLVKRNPVAIAALVLLVLGTAGALWSQGTPEDIALFTNKYSKLLLIPILVTVLLEPEDRRRGLVAMTTGLLLSLVLSYGLWLDLLPPVWPLTGTADNPTALKNYISHSVFMALGVLLFALYASQTGSSVRRWVWAVLALLAAINVLFMVHGRTGYLVLAAICIVSLVQVMRWRGLVLGAALVTASFVAAFVLSPGFKDRVTLAVDQASTWNPDVASRSSVGLRLESYQTTLNIVREHPFLGVGTGGFPTAYAERVKSTERNTTRNPHNQYLLTAAELGVVGLAALLFFFFQHARASSRLLEMRDRLLARGLLTLMVVGSVFNSFLLDHNEGVFFCWLTGLLFAGVHPRPA